MRIEYAPKPGSRDLFRIIVNGDPWREVHRVIFGRKQRLPETLSSLDELEEKCAEIEFGAAKRYAYWRLARWSQCSAELRSALEKYRVSEPTCQRILDHLTELGYINDSEYLQRFVNAERARGKGPAAIKAKLYRKGLGREEIDDALANDAEGSQAIAIAKLLATRYKRRDLKDRKERQKVVSSLARRGFSLDVILATLQIEA